MDLSVSDYHNYYSQSGRTQKEALEDGKKIQRRDPEVKRYVLIKCSGLYRNNYDPPPSSPRTTEELVGGRCGHDYVVELSVLSLVQF